MHCRSQPRLVSRPICPPCSKYARLSTVSRRSPGSSLMSGQAGGLPWTCSPLRHSSPGTSRTSVAPRSARSKSCTACSPSPSMPYSAPTSFIIAPGAIAKPAPPSRIGASVASRATATIWPSSGMNECELARKQLSLLRRVMPTSSGPVSASRRLRAAPGSSSKQRSMTSTSTPARRAVLWRRGATACGRRQASAMYSSPSGPIAGLIVLALTSAISATAGQHLQEGREARPLAQIRPVLPVAV